MGRAEGGIAAERGPRSIGVPILHLDCVAVPGREKNQAVGPYPVAPIADLLDLLTAPVLCRRTAYVEHHKIIARTRHLIEFDFTHRRPNIA
jgi:hypothetical protein